MARENAPSLTPSGVWRPRRSRWPLLVLGLLLVGGAVGTWRLLSHLEVHPERILVAVQTRTTEGVVGRWWGSHGRASARLADRLGANLRKLGLDPLSAGDPELLEALEGVEDPRAIAEVARGFGAGHVIFGTVRGVRRTGAPGSKRIEVSIDAELFLRSTEAPPGGDPHADRPAAAGEARPGIPVSEAPIRYFQVAGDEDLALRVAARSIADSMTARIAYTLVARTDLGRLKRKAEIDEREIRLSVKLAPLFRRAVQWDTVSGRRVDEAERLEREEEDQGFQPHQRLGPPLGEEYAIGPGPVGTLVLMTEPRYLDLLPGDTRYTVRVGHDRIEILDLASLQRRTRLSTYNIFSSPSVSLDGRWVALVIDDHGASRSLALVSLKDGSVRELIRHEEHDFSDPKVAPDGDRVVFWFRRCKRCRRELQVIASDGSGRRTLLPEEEEERSRPAFSRDGRVVYLSRQPAGDPSTVWMLSLTDDTMAPVLGLAAGNATPLATPATNPVDSEEKEEAGAGGGERAGPSSFARPALSADGRTLAVIETAPGLEGARPYLGLFDLEKETYRRLAEGKLRGAYFRPDGKTVAVETWDTPEEEPGERDDLEIALIDVATGAARVLTRNGSDDRLAGWSDDGRFLFVHRGSRDPDGTHWSNRVYRLAVP